MPLGSRQAAQRLGVALVDQELSVVPALTVLDNLLLGDVSVPLVNRRRAAAARCRQVLDDMGLDRLRPRQPLSELSIGERQLVEVARALSQNARLVILDEPTATLSDVETEYVFAAIRRVAAQGCSVIFVSHRLSEVLDLCDTVTVLRDGRRIATTPSAELTVNDLIVQMLGEAPHRLTAARSADPRPGHVLRIEHCGCPDGSRTSASPPRPAASTRWPGSWAAVRPTRCERWPDCIRRRQEWCGCATRPCRFAAPVGAARAGVAFVSNDRKSEGLFLDKPIAANLPATRLPSLSRGGVLRQLPP